MKKPKKIKKLDMNILNEDCIGTPIRATKLQLLQIMQKQDDIIEALNYLLKKEDDEG